MPANKERRGSVTVGDLVTVRGKKVWKPYTEMNPTELKEATAEFDTEFVADTFGSLPSPQRRKWNSIKRGRGRPKFGKGVKVVSVSVEKTLLGKADRLAKKLKISRARLISKGLETMLRQESPSNLLQQPSSHPEVAPRMLFHGRPRRRITIS